MNLTVPQQRILTLIAAFWKQHGYGPSVRDLMKQSGFRSPRAVTFHLEKLEQAGAVERDSHARSLRIKREEHDFTLPIYGAIPAGGPEVQNQLALGELAVPPALATAGVRQHGFALRVRGDSMVDAGIHDDDIAIVEQRPARPNDIVVALVDGESTLKRLIKRNGGFVLKAENPRYPLIIPVDKLEVQGVVVGIFRQF